MANLRTWLEEVEREYGEEILAMVVGPHYKRKWGEREPLPDENVILSREAGLRKVDEEYNSGYGGADCYPLYAWTKSRVFFVGEYDGSTGLSWVPRDPVSIEPGFSGA
jgi:hypothetical protein